MPPQNFGGYDAGGGRGGRGGGAGHRSDGGGRGSGGSGYAANNRAFCAHHIATTSNGFFKLFFSCVWFLFLCKLLFELL